MGHRDGRAIPTLPTRIKNIEHRCLSVLTVRWLEWVYLILRPWSRQLWLVLLFVGCLLPPKDRYMRCAFEPYGLPAFGGESRSFIN